MKYVTVTANTTTVDAKIYNNVTRQITVESVTFRGNLDDKSRKAIARVYEKQDYKLLKLYDDTAVINSETYKLDETEFYAYAVQVEKRPNGDYVSRTRKAYKYNVTLYNGYTDTVDTVTKYATTDNLDKAIKAISKDYKNTDNVVLEISLVNEIETLYLMPLDEFIRRAKASNK